MMGEWVETWCRPSGWGPRWARVSAQVASAIAHEVTETFEASARRTRHGDESFTAKVPGELAAEHLDPETGLARVGTRVTPGTVLVGKVAPLGNGQPTINETPQHRFRGEGAPLVRDSSMRVPDPLRGVVVRAELREPRSEDELAGALIEVARPVTLAIGDQLAIEGHGCVLVAEIADGIDGIEVDGAPEGAVRVALARRAEDSLEARSVGPYAAVSQQPLGGKAQFGGQRLEEHHLRALIGGGARWTAAECWTFKAGDVAGRGDAYVAMVSGRSPVPYRKGAAGAPIEAAKLFFAEARSLGFAIDVAEGGATARWLTPRAIVESSHGAVTRAETLDPQSLEPVPGGLSCPRIFGPTRDFECACGKYVGSMHRGVVCEACGIEVAEARVRRERFGHLELSVPVLHPWLVETIGRLLGVAADEVAARGAAWARSELAALDRQGAGSEVDPAPEHLVVTAVPVLPPDLRPLMPLDDGSYRSVGLTELYRRLIAADARARELKEGQASAEAVDAAQRAVQLAYERIVHNAHMEAPLADADGQPLACLASALELRCARNLVSKRVDYSGQAHLVVDRTLGEGECRLPRAVALELFKPFVYRALHEGGHARTIKKAKQLATEAFDLLAEGPSPEPPEPPPAEPPPLFRRGIEELPLTVQTYNAIANAGIATIGALASRTEGALRDVPHLGQRGVVELRAVLFDLGLDLGMDIPEAQTRPAPRPAMTRRPRTSGATVLELLDPIALGRPLLLVQGRTLVARRITLWDSPAVGVTPSTARMLSGLSVALHLPLGEQARAESAALPDRPPLAPRKPSGWLSELLFGAAPSILARGALANESDPLRDPVAWLAIGLRAPA